MSSDDGSCVGFLPKTSDPAICLKCSQRQEDHISLFISPIMSEAKQKPMHATQTVPQAMVRSASSAAPQANNQQQMGSKQKAHKSTPPPRPKTLPSNYKKVSSAGSPTKQKPKMLSPRSKLSASATQSTDNKKSAVSPVSPPTPQKPTRSPSHRAKYLAHRKLDMPLLPNRTSKTVKEETNKKTLAADNREEAVESPTSTPSRRSRSSSRSRKKRRAPTPVRKPVDDLKSSTEVSTDESAAEDNSTSHRESASDDGTSNTQVKFVKHNIQTSEIEQMLKRRLTTINAQLHYINNSVDDHKSLDAPHSTADDKIIKNADESIPEDLNDLDEKTTPNDETSTAANGCRVKFDVDVVVINDCIEDWNLSDSESETSEFGVVEEDPQTDSDDNEDEILTVEQSTDVLLSCDEVDEDAMSDSSTITVEGSRQPTQVHSADEAETSSLVHEPTRASRSRERFRKKEQAPTPPGVTAPSLKNIALRLDSTNYNYKMNKTDSGEEVSIEPPQRTLRSKSVDRSFEKSRKKMPPAKNFFKTLLRKGKSKQDMAAPEFEAVSPSETEDHGIEDDEGVEVEGKLPKEFLDTWVNSTTHQLMDEMDQALKGVWPYDKKEDTSSYRRKSTSHADIIDSLADESQTTMKRKSKHQTPSSAWSDRGGNDTVSSNFILKEKTKKSSPSTSNGTLRSLRSQYASQPALHQLAQPKAGEKSRSPSKERRSSRDMTVTESDGSLPKTKFREQFLQKLQREGQAANGKEYRDSKSMSNPEPSGSSGTLLKKKNKSSDTNKSQTWDNKSQISSILKNGSGSSTPNGTVSKSKKVPPIASHGRQSSVPSSTYSGSSSGNSAECRSKEEQTEGKISPSNSNPHDSGYESGTVRSRKDILAQVHHQHNSYESATISRNRKEIPKDSSFESGTMKPRKEMASNADFATLKRVKRSPTLSLTSRSTPRGASTSIDSIPLCFEQLTAMNVSTLQQLCAGYIQSQKPVPVPEVTPRWHDIGLMDELQPIFTSTKLVLYKGYWRNNPTEVFTVMLSLREPAKFQSFKPNLLRTNVTFEANVASHLIPASLYTGKKLMQKSAPVAEPAPKESQSIIPQHSRNMSTPAFNTQMSVDDSLLNGKSDLPQPKEVKQHPARLSQISSIETESRTTEPNRDSVFTQQTSHDSVVSMESIQEQAAVDSILMAVAGEDEPEIPDIPDIPDQPAQLPSIKKAEPVKLTNKVEAYTSAVRAPLAERFTASRTAELFNGTSSNNNKYNRILPGLKTAGLVKNRIANLNNNNSNNCDEDESDDEFDFQQLNSNNNNNLDAMPTGAGADFSVASHLLEMAGGEFHQPQAESREDSDSASEPTPRGAAGLSRCQDKVSHSQSVTCFVTILPSLPRVESIKSYLERLKSENRTKEDLEMDVIFVLLQILNIIFGLHENQLRLDSISMTDFLVVTDTANVSTVHCHMINATQSPNQKIGLTCEKLRMFLMQISHSTESLRKSVIFTTVDDMIQNADDLGDLKTIAAILQYLLWGPKEDEVKVITLAEHRRQAFELWLQLARGKLVSSLALKPIDNLKAHMVTTFLANTNGSELFKITKLLNTY